jgi:hypothetical protein
LSELEGANIDGHVNYLLRTETPLFAMGRVTSLDNVGWATGKL